MATQSSQSFCDYLIEAALARAPCEVAYRGVLSASPVNVGTEHLPRHVLRLRLTTGERNCLGMGLAFKQRARYDRH